MDLLDRMLGYDQWTTEAYFAIAATLPEAQVDQPFELGHRTLRATLSHMVDAMQLWTMLMAGTKVSADIQPPADRSLAALRERHARAYPAFAAQARAAMAEGRLDATFIDHYQNRQTFGGTILQVFVHNAQHRSEARHMFARLGITDLWDGDPREWEHATGVL